MATNRSSSAAQHRWKELAQTLLTIVLSTVLALVGGEILVRLFVPVRAVGPSLTVHDPILGKGLKASFVGTSV